MNAFATTIGKLLQSRWFWIAVALLVAVVIINKNWDSLRRLWKRDRGDYSDPPPGDARQAQLEAMAREGFAMMDGWIQTGDLIVWLEQLNALNDTELRVVATFFPSINGDGDSLRAWIDDEILPQTDVDALLMARLDQMAL